MNSPYININEIKSSQIKNVLPLLFMILSGVLILGLNKFNLITASFYVLIIIFSVGFIWISQNATNDISKNLFFLLSFLIIFFVLAFRKISGIDDPVYYSIFDLVGGKSLLEYFNSTEEEIGFKFLNYIIYKITNGNYYICQIIFSFIPLAIFYNAFKKYSNFINLPLALFILLSTVYFQILAVALVRIFIAMAIFFNSLEYIWQKKPIKYILMIIFASLFHMSSLFWLILLPFSFNIKINNKKIFKIAYYFIIMIVIPVVLIIVGTFLVPNLGVKYSGYTFGNGLKINLFSFDIVPIIILGLFFKKYIPEEYKEQYVISLIILTFSPIISVFSTIINFGRLILYSNLARIIILPMGFRFIPKEKSVLKYLYGSFIILYGFLYVYRTEFVNFMANLFPYHNLFFVI